MLIVTTATFGLLLVGLLAISMTPERTAAPDTSATLSLPPPRVRDGGATGRDRSEEEGDSTDGTAAVSVSLAVTNPPRPATTLMRPSTTRPMLAPPPAYPMLTPVGEDGFALASASAVGDVPVVEAQLPSGEVVDAEVLYARDDIAVVVLPPWVRSPGLELSTMAALAPTDTVVVGAFGPGEPLIVTVRELAVLDIPDGTPVIDADGNLIGLCTIDRQAGEEARTTSLTPVATLPTVPAPTTPPRPTTPSTTTPPTTTPPTTAGPTTTTPETAPSTSPPTTPTTVSAPASSIVGSN